ncbi:MAG: hypothetical protein NTZ18_00835 [Candidatus Komeilibacteria bacterium]|nr:hypothetical protein [Candidatus Komeilibacteria bacterium]
MPNYYHIIGLVAGLLSFSAYVLYIITTLKGKTKPNKATWWILTLIGLMIASSYYAEGARDTMWIALSYIAGPLIIAFLSLKYGEGSWETLDKICLAVALASAVVWYLSSSALLVLMINIFMDAVGLIPTIKKSYLRPENEDRFAWTIESVAGLLTLLAIEKWSFSIAVYPLYLVFINNLVLFLLYRPLIRKLKYHPRFI